MPITPELKQTNTSTSSTSSRQVNHIDSQIESRYIDYLFRQIRRYQITEVLTDLEPAQSKKNKITVLKQKNIDQETHQMDLEAAVQAP